MELEVLKGKFNEALGSTKLQLSDRTLDGVLQDALAEIGDDDSRVTDDFIQRKINLAKTIDGQINHDVSTRIEDWKKKNPIPKPQEDPNEPAWFKTYREQQEKKMKELEDARKADVLKANKAKILEDIKKGIKADYEKQNLEVNDYLLKQALREVEIPDENADVKAIIKSVESEYDAAVKAVGFTGGAPKHNEVHGDKKIVDAMWAKKKAREGWGEGKK